MCEIEENVIAGIPDFFYPIGYDVPNPADFIFAESKDIIKKRLQIEKQLTVLGGGIEPSTGYSRRVMAEKPWINFQRPISLKTLPNWNTFIAGVDSAPKMRYDYLRGIRAEQPLKKYSDVPVYVCGIIMVILLGMLLKIKMK